MLDLGKIRRLRLSDVSNQAGVVLLIVILLSLPALAPLLRPGFFSSDDGLLHLYRMMGLDHAIQAGVLYPRWLPDFAFGYGQPVINFYGPFSYYIGQIVRVVNLGAIAATKWSYGLAALAAGMTMFLFTRRIFERRSLPAAVAALAYVYAPYHLANLYVRGAMAELWAMAWFPLILWAFTRVVYDNRKAHITTAGLGLAGLVVSHSLSLLIFGPALTLYLIILLLLRGTIRPLWGAMGAIGLSIMLSAFYWLPALLESQYVGLGGGASAGYREHLAPLNSMISRSFLYQYYPAQRTIAEHPVGLLQFLLSLPAVLLLRATVLPRARLIKPSVGAMFGIAMGSILMNTTASSPIWRAFEPALAYLQYPWRYQAMTSLSLAFQAGAAVLALYPSMLKVQLRPVSFPVAPMATAGAMILLLAGASLARLPARPAGITEDAVTLLHMWTWEREVGQIGTTWTGEYLPVWVQEQRWAIGRSWLDADGPDIEEAGRPIPPDRVYPKHKGFDSLSVEVSNETTATLLWQQFYYPGMRAKETTSGNIFPAYPYGTLGLAAVALPAGQHHLRLGLAPTPAQVIGSIVSLAAALLLAGLLWLWDRRRTLLLAAAGVLVFLLLLFMRQWTTPAIPQPTEIQADLGHQATLLAYSIGMTRPDAGETVELQLYWLARSGFESDLVSFIHLSSTDGLHILAQSDQQPNAGFTPTTRWVAGEIILDRHHLTLPLEMAAGQYALFAGMYHPGHPPQNLEVTASMRPAADGRVQLGFLEVNAP